MSPDRLASIRAQLRLTQAEMAGLLGVQGERTVRKWEKGERPVPRMVAQFVRVLILSPEATRNMMIRQARIST